MGVRILIRVGNEGGKEPFTCVNDAHLSEKAFLVGRPAGSANNVSHPVGSRLISEQKVSGGTFTGWTQHL